MSEPTPSATVKTGISPAGWCLLVLVLIAGTAILIQQHGSPVVPKLQEVHASGEAAQANFTTALAKLDQRRPDEALPYLIKALENEPQHLSAQAVLLDVLRNTTWHLPLAEWQLPFPVKQIAFGASSDSLFTSIEEDSGTSRLSSQLRWNLSDLSVRAVLPASLGSQTEAISLSPDERFMVLQQNSEKQHRTLLVDPQTMRVISELSPAQTQHGSTSCFAWSGDSALFAYPAASDDGGSIWRIIDSASGETVRESDPIPGKNWLAAVFSESRLRGISANGYLLELPLQPNQPTRFGENLGNFHQALLSKDGRQLTATEHDEKGQLSTHTWQIQENTEKGSLELAEQIGSGPRDWQFAENFRDSFPWSKDNIGFWQGFTDSTITAPFPNPLQIKESVALLVDGSMSAPQFHAPMVAEDDISAIATHQDRIAIASRSGKVQIYQSLPRLMAALPASEITNSEPPLDVANSLEAELSPVMSGILRVEELETGKKLAAFTNDKMVIFAREGDAWKMQCETTLHDGIALHELSHDRIAVLTRNKLLILHQQDLSKLEELPLDFEGDEAAPVTWASSSDETWLALQCGPHLRAWSIMEQLTLLHRDSLPSGSVWAFEKREGVLGLADTRQINRWLPMARIEGLGALELRSLQALSLALNGSQSGLHQSNSMEKLADGIQPTAISALLPIDLVYSFKKALQEVKIKTPPNDFLLPLWQQLAQNLPEDQMLNLAKWASQLGLQQPWYQDFLRGQICKQDEKLYSLLLNRPTENSDASFDPQAITQWHQLAGDSVETVQLKLAAWSYLRSESRQIIPLLTTEELMSAFPDINFEEVAKLNPQAIEALRNALAGSDASDPLLPRIREVQQRASIQQLLEAHLDTQRKAYEQSADTLHLFSLAEAMSWLGKIDDARNLLNEHLLADAKLNSAQCYFLISTRISHPSLASSATELHSERIWRTWLQITDHSEELVPKVEAILNATRGTGPITISALAKALEINSLPSILRCLDMVKELPPALRDYCGARCLWSEGKKAQLYELWPEEIPDLRAKSRNANWYGWDKILAGKDYDQFYSEIQDDLKAIQINDQQSTEQLKVTANTLQLPETIQYFGAKRVRNAQLNAALILSRNPELTSIALLLSQKAQLAGADPVACLRAEARSLATSGNPHEAYKRWLLVLDSEFEGKVIAEDYLDAAQVIFQDGQDIAGMELLFRGQRANPGDVKFALRAGWMALITQHAEQAYGLFTRMELESYPAADKETLLALTCAAAELGGRQDLADKHFLQLIHTNQQWHSEENLNNLAWPDDVKGAIIGVAKRQ